MAKILITGASGKLGSLVIRHLVDSQGLSPADIIAGSRNPQDLEALKTQGIETRKVDFSDEAGLSTAFSGVERLLIISTDAIGQRLAQHVSAVHAAKAAGVKRVFYTSMPKADASAIQFAPEHLGTEEAIKASGLAYTIFRNGWYMENLLMSLPKALASGQWFSASGEGGVSYIARNDIASAIAAGLARPVSDNVTYTLTGSRAFSKREIAALVTKTTGKPLTVVDISDEALIAGMEAAGFPAAVAPVFASIDKAIRQDDLAMVTDDAEQLTGKPRVSFEAFITASKDALLG
ncbi:SDR family oxidoreductase [Allorhizobium sp. BGMRC 0089]|uniref:SDR family oxidoreductase n=1 Tax=Allorhizobium sonneratiae TaxID=2934936 RepID=UPI002033535F|nr:SDR family oxidoreductase [Allorhizobium sonneratiae]MCM2292787.1 SDR family oxidoreductase [Allorhizobium sonneratiae]